MYVLRASKIRQYCVQGSTVTGDQMESQTLHKSKFCNTFNQHISNTGLNNFLISNKEKREKSKRFRSAFTSKQLSLLENEFKRDAYVNNNRREELAYRLGLSERTIKIWFQNRRMKEKKEGSRHLDDYQYDVDPLFNEELSNICISPTNNSYTTTMSNYSKDEDKINTQTKEINVKQKRDFDEERILRERNKFVSNYKDNDKCNVNVARSKHITNRDSNKNDYSSHRNMQAQASKHDSHSNLIETSTSNFDYKRNSPTVAEHKYYRKHINSSKSFGLNINSTKYDEQHMNSSNYDGQHINSTKYNDQNINSTKYYGQHMNSTKYEGQNINSTKYDGQNMNSIKYDGQHINSSKYDGQHSFSDLNKQPTALINQNLAWNPFSVVPLLATSYRLNSPYNVPNSSYDNGVLLPPAPKIINCNCNCHSMAQGQTVIYASYIPQILGPITDPNNNVASSHK